LVGNDDIVSTREVLREIEDGAVEGLRDWAAQNIERQKLLKGGRNADPFIIAKAAVTQCTVVTMEQFRPNAVKIPNICGHFGIPCMTLENFMESEGWEF
jgi:Domain of unknown function (DUF4411)